MAIYENCWNEPWSLDRCQDQGQLTEWCWGTCDHYQWGGMTKEWKRECRSALDCCYEFPLLLWIHPLVCSGLLYHFGTSSEELRTLWKLVFKAILINHFQHMYSIVISTRLVQPLIHKPNLMHCCTCILWMTKTCFVHKQITIPENLHIIYKGKMLLSCCSQGWMLPFFCTYYFQLHCL